MSDYSAEDAKAFVSSAIKFDDGKTGVALFGKSTCPFCKKAKAALLSIGVHAHVVELDELPFGGAVQAELEKQTGKSTVPNVWLGGKFFGGSEEVIAGVKDGAFDAVEKGEVVVPMEEEAKAPLAQGPNAIKVGDVIPDIGFWQGFPDDTKVSLADIGKDQNFVVIGLPGAFTPTWSNKQVPAYIEQEDKLKEAGVDRVYVYCVNDPAVMSAWAKDQGVKVYKDDSAADGGFVTFLSDADGSFTKACGMEMTHPGPLGVGIIGRCKRWALYASGGKAKVVSVSEYEGDPAGDGNPELTLPAAMIEAIKAA